MDTGNTLATGYIKIKELFLLIAWQIHNHSVRSIRNVGESEKTIIIRIGLGNDIFAVTLGSTNKYYRSRFNGFPSIDFRRFATSNR
jgi:hypothetical protein